MRTNCEVLFDTVVETEGEILFICYRKSNEIRDVVVIGDCHKK